MFAAAIKDPIAIAPTIAGTHGKAWLLDVAAQLERANFKPEDDSVVASWLIEAPSFHPAWHSYHMIAFHLRPMPDGRKTTFCLPRATHEMTLHALDPEQSRVQFMTDGVPPWLTPTNFGAQMIMLNDSAAREKIRESVQEICAGKLSPDTDFLGMWIARYGDNMLKGRATRH